MTPAEAAGFLCRDEDEVRKKAKQMKIPYGQARSYCHYRLRRGRWVLEGFRTSSLSHLQPRARDTWSINGGELGHSTGHPRCGVSLAL